MIARGLAAFAALAASMPLAAQDAPRCQRELVVLGAGQDAGAPQIGNADDSGPRLLPSSLALIDRAAGKRYLFDASPAITEQLALLDEIEPPAPGSEARLGLDGVFLTHAHMGHYLGLAWLGFEAADPKGVPVYAMPRMASYLRANGPWSQLVELGNIDLREIEPRRFHTLDDGFRVIASPVPHRDEYSETVGFALFPKRGKKVGYIPDIDSWEEWERDHAITLRRELALSDLMLIDATFWDDNELGRDMTLIPHPRVKATMDMLQDLPSTERSKVHFIHYNHSNPIRDPDSAESREVEARGFNVARRGDRFCLD